jgi:uncharacterized protein YqjF (DUF2071 family)
VAAAFLTAEWKMLTMANYAIDPSLLAPYLPAQTEIDLWEGRCYVSLVGFLFAGTRLKGIKVPFHSDFEEVNLRFYVRHRTASGEWRRGVVFISEIVPKPALAYVANFFYKEHYQYMPMRHAWHLTEEAMTIQYEWKGDGWNSLCVVTETTPLPISAESEEAFITEHYFGYGRIDAARTTEYQVDHPAWRMYPVQGYEIKVDFGRLYGSSFAFLEGRTPQSILLAEGSEICVRSKRVIESRETNNPNS